MRPDANLDKNELRPSVYGAADFFLSQTGVAGGIITPELQSMAQNSIGNTLETPVFDYDSGVTISNARTLTIPDSENTTRMVQFNFATYTWGFTQVKAAFMNNEVKLQEDYDFKFRKYLYKFMETMDSAALAALSTAKTQVFADTLGYTVTGNTIQVPNTQKEDIFGDIGLMMNANDYYGQMHLVGNFGMSQVLLKMKQHGLYNDKNLQLEYQDKIVHTTPRLSNAVGDHATFYAVQSGNVGVLTRFEREALLGSVSRDGNTEWGIITLPGLNMQVGTYTYQNVGNQSAIAGAATADLDRGLKDAYGFAVDVCFVTAYNSAPTTRANPVMKVAIQS